MAATRPKPENRSQEKREKILQAAISLFSEQGYHHSSTRQIAKAAGVSEGTVFNNFESKSALLEVIIQGFYERLRNTAQEGLVNKHGCKEQFDFLAENHICVISEDNFLLMRLLAVYFSEHFNFYLDYRNSSIFKHSKIYTSLFDQVIREGIARKELKEDIKLSAMRDLFFGSMEYGVRSMLAQLEAEETKLDQEKLKAYAHSLCQPIWQSMENSKNQLPKGNKKELDLCERLERIADRLEEKI